METLHGGEVMEKQGAHMKEMAVAKEGPFKEKWQPLVDELQGLAERGQMVCMQAVHKETGETVALICGHHFDLTPGNDKPHQVWPIAVLGLTDDLMNTYEPPVGAEEVNSGTAGAEEAGSAEDGGAKAADGKAGVGAAPDGAASAHGAGE